MGRPMTGGYALERAGDDGLYFVGWLVEDFMPMFARPSETMRPVTFASRPGANLMRDRIRDASGARCRTVRTPEAVR